MLRPRKVAFSIREVADLTGMNKAQASRLLVANGVRFARTGNKRLVFLSDLETSMPELMDSVRFSSGDDE